MNIFESIVLGIVQGLTEFIPVSSSGHLELIPKLFGWNEPSTVFITFLHFGTLLSLVFFYRKLLLKYFKVLLKTIRKNDLDKDETADKKVMINLIIATIPAGVIGLIAEQLISDFYDDPVYSRTVSLLTIGALILVGVIFIVLPRVLNNKKHQLEKLTHTKAFIIGVSQAAAFVRGVSRSGVILLTGQLLGLKRVAAAEFGFLMSIPIVTATSVYGIYKLLKLPPEQLQLELVPALIGALFALISGILAINFMLKFLKNRGLSIFGFYRIIFGLIALGLLGIV